ncbi:hypothetical protein YC2023_061162 [Brassica napus]
MEAFVYLHDDFRMGVYDICWVQCSDKVYVYIQFIYPTQKVVRVSNELGAGNPKSAAFSVIIVNIYSLITSVILAIVILACRDFLSYAFTEGKKVSAAVSDLCPLLALTLVLNGIQPGIWTGMICGTLIQTVILAWVTFRTDWTKEVEEASKRLDKWSNKKLEVQIPVHLKHLEESEKLWNLYQSHEGKMQGKIETIGSNDIEFPANQLPQQNKRKEREYTLKSPNTKPKLEHANSRLRLIYHNMSNESGKTMMFRLIYHNNNTILQNDLTETHTEYTILEHNTNESGFWHTE